MKFENCEKVNCISVILYIFCHIINTCKNVTEFFNVINKIELISGRYKAINEIKELRDSQMSVQYRHL